MTDYFKPFDFTQIAYHPHVIPDKAIEKLPTFQGNNAITATAHLQAISKCFFSWVRDIAQQHDCVYMKLFSLCLKGDAYDWYTCLDDNSYATYAEFLKGFKERWGDKKEPRHQLAALHTIKKK